MWTTVIDVVGEQYKNKMQQSMSDKTKTDYSGNQYVSGFENGHKVHPSSTSAWPPRSQNTNGTTQEFVSNSVKDYLDNASVHGFKYISMGQHHWFERLLWTIICVIAWCGVGAIVKPTITRYINSPTITTIKTTSEPIHKVFFPAVTICNVNKADSNQVAKQLQKEPWRKYSNSSMYKFINIMSSVSQAIEFNNVYYDEADLEDIANTETHRIARLMKSVMQPIDRMALKCWWLGRLQSCSQMFRPILTDDGFCWSFNSRSDMELIKAQNTTSHGKNISLKKVDGSGPYTALTVILNPDIPLYYAPTNQFGGFKILIHHPYDYPSLATKTFLASPGSEIHMPVSVVETRSSENVKLINVDIRDCRYEDEFRLRMYSTYSYSNCLLECRVLAMNETCGCVPYVYAELGKYFSVKPQEESARSEVDNDHGTMDSCNCPPDCDGKVYSTDVTKAHFPLHPNSLNITNEPSRLNRKQLVALRVFFNDLGFIQYERDLTYTWDTFVASFGGLVSLFEGFSLVSVVEFIYFLTIRPVFRWYNGGRRRT